MLIGNQIASMRVQKLVDEGITQVLKVNGIKSMMPYAQYGIEERVVDMEDSPDYTITDKNLKDSFEFIGRPGKKTLVVCTAGISRSATVCISYLMWAENMPLAEAFDKVKSARQFINPNKGFLKFLEHYEAARKQKLLQFAKL